MIFALLVSGLIRDMHPGGFSITGELVILLLGSLSCIAIVLIYSPISNDEGDLILERLGSLGLLLLRSTKGAA